MSSNEHVMSKNEHVMSKNEHVMSKNKRVTPNDSLDIDYENFSVYRILLIVPIKTSRFRSKLVNQLRCQILNII
jgi:hypothetical protein